MAKVVLPEDIAALFKDGDSILHSCFHEFGRPDTLLQALYDSGAKDLRLISNDVNSPGQAHTRLVTEGRVSSAVVSYIGTSKETNTHP